MFRNYVRVAWRNLLNNKFYSLVNIVGLSIGIAFTLVILAFAWVEISVNKGLKNPGNQYIVQSRWKEPSMGYEVATIGEIPKSLRATYPQLVASYYRWDMITSSVSVADRSFRETLHLGDSTLLSMYGFRLLKGNAATAMSDPYTVVLTEEKALKYFNKLDVLGEVITIENFSGAKHGFRVSGVMEKPKANSILDITGEGKSGLFFGTASLTFFNKNFDGWNNINQFGAIELQQGVKAGQLDGPMRTLLKANAPVSIADNMQPYIVSLKDYQLSANNGLIRKMLVTLSGIALFILLMAIINFINLSVSRAATRMREIGIRKVLGGMRRQLMLQFLMESIMLALLATVLAFAIFLLVRPLFAEIFGKELASFGDFPAYYLSFPLILILLVGTIAGIYPAFVLSSLRAVSALKGKLGSIKENIVLRKSLVAVQFGTAMIVLVGAIVISRQIGLFFSKEIGYKKEMVVAAQLPRNWSDDGVRKMEDVRKQFAQMPQVENVSLSFEVPDGNNSGSISLYRDGAASTASVSSQLLSVDENFADTYSIPLIAGEFFGVANSITDSFLVVINERMARDLGWKDPREAIGKQVRLQDDGFAWRVTGVTKDFHFGSMQQSIQPISFMQVRQTKVFRFLSFRLRPGQADAGMLALQERWSKLLPGAPFEYRFMDETLRMLYKSEIQLKKASYTATVLSILIVLLGVLGLISLSLQRRMKEIGIRKVLGSSAGGIVKLFMKEFVQVVIVGGLIACPVAYFIMQDWLSDYVYRVRLDWVPFVSSILILGIVTMALIGVQTLRAANGNPIDRLGDQ